MRFVSRGATPPPASLSRRNSGGLTELERVRAHVSAPLAPNAKRDAFAFAAYKNADVKQRLEALFHGKCAYCESLYAAQAPVDVEHYRPKAKVDGDDTHPGYWWVAMDWENLLPSCLDCNRRRKQKAPYLVSDLRVLFAEMSSGKQSAFPVAGQRAHPEVSDFIGELALLLDPTRDDPDQHIHFHFADDSGIGLVYPRAIHGMPDALPAISPALDVVAQRARNAGLSARGAVSIQVYGLNRLRLVQERASIIRRLRFLEELLRDLGDIAQSIDQPQITQAYPIVGVAAAGLRLLQGRILTEMTATAADGAPYSAMARAYLRDFRERAQV